MDILDNGSAEKETSAWSKDGVSRSVAKSGSDMRHLGLECQPGHQESRVTRARIGLRYASMLAWQVQPGNRETPVCVGASSFRGRTGNVQPDSARFSASARRSCARYVLNFCRATVLIQRLLGPDRFCAKPRIKGSYARF